MTGRVFLPYKFKSAPTDDDLSNVDSTVSRNCIELMRYSTYATEPLIYIGGKNTQSLSNVDATDHLHITSHVHSNTSEFVVGKGDKEFSLNAQEMAKLLESEGLTKSISKIELFGCSAGRSFGKKTHILKLRELLQEYSKLNKEKKKLNKEIDNKGFFTKVTKKENRIVVIDKLLKTIAKEHNEIYANISLYDYQNLSGTDFDQYMLPLGAELCWELKKRGYKNVRVFAYVGQVEIYLGIKKIHYNEGNTEIGHFSDDQIHGDQSITRRDWNQAYIEYRA